MSQYYQITEEPMTKKERNKLRNGLFFLPIFIIGPLIFYFVMADDPWHIKMETPTYFIIGFFVFFYGVLGYIARTTYLDWKSGMKDVIKGIITRKEHTVHRKKKGGSTHRYYLHFDDFRLHVKLHHYGSVNEGDMVTFKYGKRTHIIFEHETNEKNALIKLQQKGAELKPPKAPKQLSFVQTILIFLTLVFVVLNLVFWAVSDCFMCGPVYKDSISGWQGYQEIEVTNEVSEAANKIMLLMTDTLKDVEEHEILTTFEIMSSNGNSGELIDFMAGYRLPNDTLSALWWMREKFNEDIVRYPTNVIDLWGRVLPFSFGAERRKGRRKENLVNLDDVRVILFKDQKTTTEQLWKWYGKNRSIRQMQYALRYRLPTDTSEFGPGANQLIKDVFSEPMAMNGSDRSSYTTARNKYGLE